MEVEPGGATDDAERGGLGGEPRLSAERDPASGGGQRLTIVTDMTTTNSTTSNTTGSNNVVSPLLSRAADAVTEAEAEAGVEAGAVEIQSTDGSGGEATLTSFLAEHNLVNYEKQILDEGFESIHDLVELKEEEVEGLIGDLGMKRGEVRPRGNSNTAILTEPVTVTVTAPTAHLQLTAHLQPTTHHPPPTTHHPPPTTHRPPARTLSP